jgi:hypothetical protein
MDAAGGDCAYRTGCAHQMDIKTHSTYYHTI